MKQSFIIFVFIFCLGGAPRKPSQTDTIAKVADTILVDTIYKIPDNTDFDKQVQNMSKLNKEAKDLYKKSLNLQRQIKTDISKKKVNDAFDFYDKMKKE